MKWEYLRTITIFYLPRKRSQNVQLFKFSCLRSMPKKHKIHNWFHWWHLSQSGIWIILSWYLILKSSVWWSIIKSIRLLFKSGKTHLLKKVKVRMKPIHQFYTTYQYSGTLLKCSNRRTYIPQCKNIKYLLSQKTFHQISPKCI